MKLPIGGALQSLGGAISRNVVPVASQGLKTVVAGLGGKEGVAQLASNAVGTLGSAAAQALANKLQAGAEPGGAKAAAANAIATNGPDFLDALANSVKAKLNGEKVPEGGGVSGAAKEFIESRSPAFLDALSRLVIGKLRGGAVPAGA
jgi:hypothetical protein